MLSVLALQERFIWLDEIALAKRLLGIEGGVVSGVPLFTVTLIELETVVFPVASLATAVKV